MKIVIVWLLLGVALGTECVKQAAVGNISQVGGVDMGIDTVVIDSVASTCASTGSCGSIIFSGTYEKTGAAPSSWAYDWEQKGCFDCAALNLNDDCITANYEFSTTVTASCIDLPLTNYQSSVSISCCSAAKCNARVNKTMCRPDTEFSQYMKSLQTCWNTASPSFMQATCDDPTLSGYISCQAAQGTSTPSRDCTYRTTCTQPIKDAITAFAQCGCKIKSGRYTDQFMTTLMTDNWKQYCKNLDFNCSNANSIVSEKQWYVDYKFLVDKEQLTPADRAKIKNITAAYLYVDEDLLTITITGKQRRRLLADESVVTVTFETDDKDIAEYAEDKFNDEQLATDIGIAIGAETTMIGIAIGAETTDIGIAIEDTTQPDTSSTPRHTVYVMALFGVIIAGFN